MLQKFTVDSMGTATYHIASSSEIGLIETGKLRGFGLSNLQASVLIVEDLPRFD